MRQFKLKLTAAAAMVIIVPAAGCTSQRAYGANALRRWAENDYRTFVHDIKSAPGWIGEQFRKDSAELKNSIGNVLRTTAADAKYTAASIADTPGYFGREAKRDLRSLSNDLSSSGDWIASDAKTFSNNISGIPGFFAEHSKRESRDLAVHVKELIRQFKDDAAKFPSRIAECFELLFIK